MLLVSGEINVSSVFCIVLQNLKLSLNILKIKTMKSDISGRSKAFDDDDEH